MYRSLVAVLVTSLCSYPTVVRAERNQNDTVDIENGGSVYASSPNPYIRGCLQSLHPEWRDRWRVCNSHDPPELRGVICEESPFVDDYLEIRVASGNWASATALAWLAQIVLSELLGVPSSVEAGGFGRTRNFYDFEGKMDDDTNVPGSAVAVPSNGTIFSEYGGDCGALENTEDDYTPCAHFFPELWGGFRQTTQAFVQEKLIEPVQGIGVLAKESWFVTAFTAKDDPTVVSYYGLMGEENRQKLAGMFKRPTTWREYCELVSTSNCSVPDATAQRYPDEDESTKMFSEGLFTGHFRFTEANNCTQWPTNCTGHIANYPCGWNSVMESSIYHLNIALDPNNGPDGSPNGYTSTQLQEMWHAANATRSNLMMMWWTPEPLYQKFLGTDAEMQHVQLKPYTLDCFLTQEAYIEETCEANQTQRVGPPEAACDNPAESLSKLITGKLYDMVYNPKIQDAVVSPAHSMLSRFRITEVQLGEIFDLWESEPTPRDAVCQWAWNNLKILEAMVPYSYPRALVEDPHSAFGYGIIGIGLVALLVVLSTSFLVRYYKRKPAVRYAQLDFMSILLAGSFLVVVGAITIGFPASDGSCISAIWFVNVGYTLELTPLIIKVAAINHMMAASRKFHRTRLNRRNLYKMVAGITLLMAVYLAIWTGVDPPTKSVEYELTESTTESGEQIVKLGYYCSNGSSNAWQYAAVCWNSVLLLCASVLAFQTRNVVQAFNESRTLAFLIYSHALFIILRIFLLIFGESFSGNMANLLGSLLISMDQMAGCVIYFLPKFLASDEDPAFRSSAAHSSRFSQGLTPAMLEETRRSNVAAKWIESKGGQVAGVHFDKLVHDTKSGERFPLGASSHQSFTANDASGSGNVDENPSEQVPFQSENASIDENRSE